MMTTRLACDLGSGLELLRFTLTYDDLTAAATTQTIALFTLLKNSIVLGCRIKHSAAFTGTAITAMTVSVGSTSLGATGLSGAAFDIYQTPAVGTRQLANCFDDGPYADEAINAYFTSTGANVTVADTGSVDIDVLVAQVSTP
jgi:hypothetical protein